MSAPTSSTGPGVVRLRRRVGFFVRQRARFGLLPGQVSTAAIVQARRYRWALWIGVPVILFMAAIPIAIVASSDATQEAPATVAYEIGPRILAGYATYEVVLDDGRTLGFERDPGVRLGDSVLVRQRGFDAPQGLIRNGVYVPSLSATGSGAAAALAVFGVYGALIALFVIPTGAWGRRVYKQLRKDLNGPTASVTGRYVGSWTWRGMSSRLWRRQHILANLAGFPVAIESPSGELSWFGAPINLLTEIRHFETAIGPGTRQVTVTYHPQSKAIARLESVDGLAPPVDLSRAIDELHPETGLSLKISRRRRHAHLPDF